MEKKFAYSYDKTLGILYKHYFGLISLEDIYSSWDYAIQNNIIPKGTRSFILDYQLASFDIKIKEYSGIAKYYKDHLEIFSGSKIAVITQTPKDVVIPTLVETHDEGYRSRPFYSLGAAIDWVLK
jgi:hypothetical protein